MSAASPFFNGLLLSVELDLTKRYFADYLFIDANEPAIFF
jgi:hypothetical protein